MAIKCLMINGSGQGRGGNSAKLMSVFQGTAKGFKFRELHLVETSSLDDVLPQLQWADAFVFVTGTYWDSWGWPLQRFLEAVTETEGTSVWLGKPAAVLVTMHSVGGKGVLSRLQGVLNTLGVLLPPMSGIVLSAVGQAALEVAEPEIADDIWCLEDLEIIAANLHCADKGRSDYQSWDVDRATFGDIWLDPDA